MKVILNIPRFPPRPLGGHIYVEQVLRSLIVCAESEVRLSIAFAGLKAVGEQRKYLRDIDPLGRARVDWIPLPGTLLWSPLFRNRLVEQLSTVDRSVIVHTFGTTPLPYNPKNLVATLQDVIPLCNLEGEASPAQYLTVKAHLQWVVDRANAIITISEFSRRQIIEKLNVDPRLIQVIPNGVDLQLYRPLIETEQASAAALLARLNISSPYLLHLGGQLPRKNVVRLIDSFDFLKSKYKVRHSLVLAGSDPPAPEVVQRVMDSPYRQDIYLPGYLARADVVVLLQSANVFVFPSYYEGFGLPCLEALACGVPLAAANAASLPEVGGDAAVYFDPFEVDDMAEKIYGIIADEELRAANILRGLARAQEFTWHRNARSTLALYESLLQG